MVKALITTATDRFKCTVLHSTLSGDACVKRHLARGESRTARAGKGGPSYPLCASCEIGKVHAALLAEQPHAELSEQPQGVVLPKPAVRPRKSIVIELDEVESPLPATAPVVAVNTCGRHGCTRERQRVKTASEGPLTTLCRQCKAIVYSARHQNRIPSWWTLLSGEQNKPREEHEALKASKHELPALREAVQLIEPAQPDVLPLEQTRGSLRKLLERVHTIANTADALDVELETLHAVFSGREVASAELEHAAFKALAQVNLNALFTNAGVSQ